MSLAKPGCSETRPVEHRLHFVDYDRDGKLDLFVSRYLEFDPGKIRRPAIPRM